MRTYMNAYRHSNIRTVWGKDIRSRWNCRTYNSFCYPIRICRNFYLLYKAVMIPRAIVPNVIHKIDDTHYIVAEIQQWQYTTYTFKRLDVVATRGLTVVTHEAKEYRIQQQLPEPLFKQANNIFDSLDDTIVSQMIWQMTTISFTYSS